MRDHVYVVLMDANNVTNPALDEQRPRGGPGGDLRPLGVAALGGCLRAWGGLWDAFRAITLPRAPTPARTMAARGWRRCGGGWIGRT